AARTHAVRRAGAAVRGAARPLVVPAVGRQRLPAGAGRRALLAPARDSRASRPHRRPFRRRARDLDAGQVAVDLSRAARRPGGRRVIVNRRGDVVEDVAAVRPAVAGRDLALSIDSRLQYLAFKELKAAVAAQKAQAGSLVILDAKTGEILALANWPTYNPNS